MYFSGKRHNNSKRIYPFWKECQKCQKHFSVNNRTQVLRNKYCSKYCANVMIGIANSIKLPESEHKCKILCSCIVCGKEIYRNRSHLKKIKEIVCSHSCNGKLRSVELIKHSHKGKSGWTEESYISYKSKMSGELNPAWKGGFFYKKSVGNYRGSKYVRCPDKFNSMTKHNGYVAEHRLLLAEHLCRSLLKTEVVHHINHNSLDNRIENLMLFKSNSDHKLYENGHDIIPLWKPEGSA